MHHLKLISIADLYSGVLIDQSHDVIRSKLPYADLKLDFNWCRDSLNTNFTLKE